MLTLLDHLRFASRLTGMLTMTGASGCPINLTMELLGDRWSLVVLRDVLFGDRRTFGVLHRQSEEGIATNVLSDRLRRLVTAGLLTRSPAPDHRQKIIYSLTEPAIQLVPVFAALGAWGRRHLPASEELSVRAELLERGGPAMWEAFMDELRVDHLGAAPRPGARSVRAELQQAYEEKVVRGDR